MLRLHRFAPARLVRALEERRGIVLLAVVVLGLGCMGGGEACESCGSQLGAGGTGGDGAGGDAGTGAGGGALAGTSGTAGDAGAAGRGGTTATGSAGAAGNAGNAGSSGSTGGGSAGTGGAAGTTGAAGRGGASGGSGTMGGAGSSGSAGTTGGAGRGGASGSAGGAAGSAGSGGTTGSAGSAGTSGVTGRGGAAGAAGATGSAGTGGTAGTTGAAGAGGGSGGSGGAGQVVMSIDFIGGRTQTGGAGGAMLVAAPAMAATEVAGVKPVARWNGAANIMGTLSNLLLADGTATTAGVVWNSPSMGNNPGEWVVGLADMPGNARMMNGYLDPVQASMPAVVTVSGLPASITGAGYDVYVYITGDVGTGTATRTYNYSIGTAMFAVTQTGPTPTSFTSFTLAPAGGAGNYVVFRNLTAATFTLTATPGTGSAARAPVNGLQIVAPTGS